MKIDEGQRIKRIKLKEVGKRMRKRLGQNCVTHKFPFGPPFKHDRTCNVKAYFIDDVNFLMLLKVL
jgi:hypothetical protein